jgi:hypothetical protein
MSTPSEMAARNRSRIKSGLACALIAATVLIANIMTGSPTLIFITLASDLFVLGIVVALTGVAKSRQRR